MRDGTWDEGHGPSVHGLTRPGRVECPRTCACLSGGQKNKNPEPCDGTDALREITGAGQRMHDGCCLDRGGREGGGAAERVLKVAHQLGDGASRLVFANL